MRETDLVSGHLLADSALLAPPHSKFRQKGDRKKKESLKKLKRKKIVKPGIACKSR